MNSSLLNFFESIVYGIAGLISSVVYLVADVVTLSA